MIGFSQKADSAFHKFDLQKFQKLKAAGLNHYYKKDSLKVTMEEFNDQYQVKINFHKSHYFLSYQYFKSNLSLRRNSKFFQHNLVGIQRVYDKRGKLLEEDYRDTSFTFSLKEVNEKLIKEFDIYIMDTKKPKMVSIENSFKPIYNIAFYLEDNPFGMWRYIQIDGKTGETLQDFKKAYECRTK